MDGDRGRGAWHYALLLIALAAVAVVHAHPHWNVLTGAKREYPTHMDEYVHWGQALSTLETGEIDAPDPFVGGGGEEFALRTYLHERGFHAYLAVLKDTTGVTWPQLFAAGPVLVALFGALALYAVAQRWDAGIEAVLWFAAVPTTLRFLGPAFLVPISFSLPLIAFGLLVLRHATEFRAYVALLVLAGAMWPLHAMGALVLLALTLAVGVASVATPARAAVLVGVVAIPAVIAYPYYAGASVQFLPGLESNIRLIHLAGIPLLAAAAIGAPFLLLRPEGRDVGLALALALVAAELILLRRVLTGEDALRLYDRTFTVLPFLAVVPAAVAVASARAALVSRLRLPPLRVAAVAVVLLLQAVAVTATARETLAQEYYEPVTAERFREYETVAPLLAGSRHIALVEGQTMPFTLATGVPTLYVFLPAAEPPPASVEAFFEGGGKDTLFLLQARVTVVVTERSLDNPYLVKLSPTVYLLDAKSGAPAEEPASTP